MDIKYLVVGKVLHAHGIKGLVLVEPMTDFPDRFVRDARFYLGVDESNTNQLQEVLLSSVSIHKNRLLIHFQGVETRSEAEDLSGYYLFIPLEEIHELKNGNYYHHQLIGVGVQTPSGEYLGKIVDLLSHGGNDLLVIATNDDEKLIPFVDEFVKRIDLEKGLMIIDPIAGLLDL